MTTPGALKLAVFDVLVSVSEGVRTAGVVWLSVGDVVAPDFAEAVLTTEPASKSACTVVYEPVQVMNAPGTRPVPMDGHVTTHIGAVQSSTLLVQRMTAKMHRQLLTWSGAGTPGICGYYLQPIMDKTQYKMQMVYPIPNTFKDAGQCCQPFGRTTMVWGAGKEFPVAGEDFSYQLFRKRNCCASAY